MVPPLVNAIRTANDATRQARVVSAVGRLNAGQLPGILASSLGLDDAARLAVLRAAVDRPDAQTLSNAPDTDLLPYLWYYAASRGEESRALREFSALTLDRWTLGKSQVTNGPAELVRISRPLARGQGVYRGDDPVKLWQFDSSTQTPVGRDATPRQADDFYALRNLRWALERNPGNPEAIELFLATTIERAVEAAQFGDVLQADPELLPILAGADSATLNTILAQALDAKRTALALGATQILAARFDKPAAGGPFLQALDYPDSRVQLAAAIGLLKVPGSVPGAKAARVVDILRRAAAAEAPLPGKTELGRAFVADPSDRRGARLARYLKDLGYGTERFATGRQLATRLREASDADLIFVDRHVGDPVVGDLLSSLRADRDSVSRPVFVVASDDYARPLPLDRILLRLANLVAVADTNPAKPPEPFRYDAIRRLRPDEVDAARDKIIADRDAVYQQLYRGRLAQLERLVAGGELPRSESLSTYLGVRLPQLTLAALNAEYPFSAASAPNAAANLAERTRTLALNPRLQYATADLKTERLARISEDVDDALDPERRAMFEKMLARTDADALLIPRDATPETPVDDRLQRIARAVGGVNVIMEPASALALSDDIGKAAADPALKPVPAAVKRHNSRLAVEYLRRMAVGEITGFDVRPAEPALRAALRDDELATAAADAVARFGTPEAQQDLIGTALGIGRPLPIRAARGRPGDSERRDLRPTRAAGASPGARPAGRDREGRGTAEPAGGAEPDHRRAAGEPERVNPEVPAAAAAGPE